MALDPQVRALLDRIEQSGAPPYHTLPAVEARQMYDEASLQLRGSPPQPYRVDPLAIPGPASTLNSLLYRPSAELGLPALIYFHGGGYTIGSLQSHDCVCRALCVETGCIVISVDYRLAPEHKYPAALEDAWGATNWLVENAEELGVDPNRIAIGGDSAGGNLATVVCLMAKQAGAPRLVYQLLIYPGTDMSCSLPSHQAFAQGYRLTSELIDWFYDHYFSPGDDLNHWRASPLNAESFADLPPAFILSAGYDPLQDENRLYGERMSAAKVPVKHSHYEGMMHGFITMPGVLDKAGEALSECAAELRVVFDV